jgi:hypothetical protein
MLFLTELAKANLKFIGTTIKSQEIKLILSKMNKAGVVTLYVFKM